MASFFSVWGPFESYIFPALQRQRPTRPSDARFVGRRPPVPWNGRAFCSENKTKLKTLVLGDKIRSVNLFVLAGAAALCSKKQIIKIIIIKKKLTRVTSDTHVVATLYNRIFFRIPTAFCGVLRNTEAPDPRSSQSVARVRRPVAEHSRVVFRSGSAGDRNAGVFLTNRIEFHKKNSIVIRDFLSIINSGAIERRPFVLRTDFFPRPNATRY